MLKYNFIIEISVTQRIYNYNGKNKSMITKQENTY